MLNKQRERNNHQPQEKSQPNSYQQLGVYSFDKRCMIMALHLLPYGSASRFPLGRATACLSKCLSFVFL